MRGEGDVVDDVDRFDGRGSSFLADRTLHPCCLCILPCHVEFIISF